MPQIKQTPQKFKIHRIKSLGAWLEFYDYFLLQSFLRQVSHQLNRVSDCSFIRSLFRKDLIIVGLFSASNVSNSSQNYTLLFDTRTFL